MSTKQWLVLTVIVLRSKPIIHVLYVRRCIVKAPHCAALAWKLPFSTWRYRVLTVCDRSRLNRATFVPDAIHTTHYTAYPRHSHVNRCHGLTKAAANYARMTAVRSVISIIQSTPKNFQKSQTLATFYLDY